MFSPPHLSIFGHQSNKNLIAKDFLLHGEYVLYVVLYSQLIVGVGVANKLTFKHLLQKIFR